MASAPTLTTPVASRSKCANCSAPVGFDPGSGGLRCEYCDSRRAIERVSGVPRHLLAESEAFLRGPAPGPHALLHCRNCGARSESASTTVATRCGYCLAPLSVPEREEGVPPAEGIVPFAVTRDAAGARFRDWLGRLWFRPGNLRRLARMHELRGIYVPTWIYDAHAESWWTAEAGYHYYVEETEIVNGQKQTRRVQKTRWEHASGSRADQYADEIASASAAVGTQEMQPLAPFNLDEGLAQFNGDYVAGFEAETHARSPAQAWPEVEERIRADQYSRCGRDVPGDTHRNLSVRTSLSRELFRSVLLPVYVAAYAYQGKLFRVLINGRTGSVSGKAPWSVVKIVAFILTLLAATAAVVWISQQQ